MKSGQRSAVSGQEIKTVIFDLGNVLALHDARIAARRYAKLTGLTFKEVWDTILTSKTEKAYTRGEMTSYQFYRYAKGLAKTDVKMSYAQFRDIWNEIFVENKGMEAVLKNLKKNYPLYLISNTNAMHWNYLLPKYKHLLMHFKRRFPSHEVGHRKPNPEIYLKVLKLIGKFKPEETVFIDDHPGFIEGARSVGMNGILFKSPSQLLRELKKLGIQTS